MTELWQHVLELVSKLLHVPWWKIISALLLACFGGMRAALLSIFILYCADWITGIWYAWVTSSLSSDKALRGVIKMFLYGGVILVGAQLSKASIAGIQAGLVIGSACDWGVAITEGISVLENLDALAVRFKLDIPLIRILARRLKQRRDRDLEAIAEAVKP